MIFTVRVVSDMYVHGGAVVSNMFNWKFWTCNSGVGDALKSASDEQLMSPVGIFFLMVLACVVIFIFCKD